jgi:DNA-binding SARP family transcriptional activator
MLRKLRADLGPVIVTRGNQEVGLDAGGFWCDANDFDRHLEEGRAREAIELYQRDLLDGFYLSGCSQFERWLTKERRRLRRGGADAAWALAEATQDPVEAARWARRAARFTPREEAAARRLMTFLDTRGDQVAAIEVFERFSARMRDELGVGPGPTTESLAEALRAKAPPRAEPLLQTGGPGTRDSRLDSGGAGLVAEGSEVDASAAPSESPEPLKSRFRLGSRGRRYDMIAADAALVFATGVAAATFLGRETRAS